MKRIVVAEAEQDVVIIPRLREVPEIDLEVTVGVRDEVRHSAVAVDNTCSHCMTCCHIHQRELLLSFELYSEFCFIPTREHVTPTYIVFS
jgi:hypothetical protein